MKDIATVVKMASLNALAFRLANTLEHSSKVRELAVGIYQQLIQAIEGDYPFKIVKASIVPEYWDDVADKIWELAGANSKSYLSIRKDWEGDLEVSLISGILP